MAVKLTWFSCADMHYALSYSNKATNILHRLSVHMKLRGKIAVILRVYSQNKWILSWNDISSTHTRPQAWDYMQENFTRVRRSVVENFYRKHQIIYDC